MNKIFVILFLVVGMLFGSLLTYAIASTAMGEDIFSQHDQIKSTANFLDSVQTAVRHQRVQAAGSLESTPITFDCTELGCLIGQGEMSRVQMDDDSACVWRRTDATNPNPVLEVTRTTHFIDLTGDQTGRAESVICRDVNGKTFFGKRQP